MKNMYTFEYAYIQHKNSLKQTRSTHYTVCTTNALCCNEKKNTKSKKENPATKKSRNMRKKIKARKWKMDR